MIKTESLLAVITARGGSKRIPRKNIKDFLGKPILFYSIKAANESKLFDEVMVSTEDKEIAGIAKRYGACVPFYRSMRASDDFATTADVLVEVIRDYEKSGRYFDWVCCLYPTAPFVTAEKLLNAWDLLKKTDADALTPIVKFSYPPQRSLKLDDKYLVYNFPENRNKRSQDLAPYYHDVGQFYFLRIGPLLKEKSLLLKRTIPYEIDELEMQDIDNLTDWKLAEIKYQMTQSRYEV